MNLHLIAVLIVLLAAGSVVTPWLTGWGRLARAYAFRSEFDGEKWGFQNGRLRSTRLGLGLSYNFYLTFGGNPRGLYVAPWPFSWPGYPPLFIPWSEIDVRNWKSLWMKGVELRFRQAPSVLLQIRQSLAGRLAKAGGNAWPEGKRMAS